MFCKHKWEVLSETTTKSRIEVLCDAGVAEAKGLTSPADRKFIQIVQCSECGKLKRFVEDI